MHHAQVSTAARMQSTCIKQNPEVSTLMPTRLSTLRQATVRIWAYHMNTSALPNGTNPHKLP